MSKVILAIAAILALALVSSCATFKGKTVFPAAAMQTAGLVA